MPVWKYIFPILHFNLIAHAHPILTTTQVSLETLTVLLELKLWVREQCLWLYNWFRIKSLFVWSAFTSLHLGVNAFSVLACNVSCSSNRSDLFGTVMLRSGCFSASNSPAVTFHFLNFLLHFCSKCCFLFSWCSVPCSGVLVSRVVDIRAENSNEISRTILPSWAP